MIYDDCGFCYLISVSLFWNFTIPRIHHNLRIVEILKYQLFYSFFVFSYKLLKYFISFIIFKDDKYHQQKRQYEELEQKLRYIKKLVVEYDNSLINACE